MSYNHYLFSCPGAQQAPHPLPVCEHHDMNNHGGKKNGNDLGIQPAYKEWKNCDDLVLGRKAESKQHNQITFGVEEGQQAWL